MSSAPAERLLRVVNEMLAARGLPKPFTMQYVDDDLVDYAGSEVIHVRRDDLTDLHDPRMARLLSSGASWVHANYLGSVDDEGVVTLRRGGEIPGVENSDYPINTSYETRGFHID